MCKWKLKGFGWATFPRSRRGSSRNGESHKPISSERGASPILRVCENKEFVFVEICHKVGRCHMAAVKKVKTVRDPVSCTVCVVQVQSVHYLFPNDTKCSSALLGSVCSKHFQKISPKNKRWMKAGHKSAGIISFSRRSSIDVREPCCRWQPQLLNICPDL